MHVARIQTHDNLRYISLVIYTLITNQNPMQNLKNNLEFGNKIKIYKNQTEHTLVAKRDCKSPESNNKPSAIVYKANYKSS